VHTLQAGLVVNAFGNGMAGPFTLVYLHEVRGIPIGLAGIASAITAAAGLFSTLGAAAVAERIGMRTTLLVGLGASTVAFLLYPLVQTASEAWLLALLAGSGFGAWFSMQSTLLVAIVPPERRHAAFAHQRVAANLGLGLGGLVGGLITAAATASSFTQLFYVNAATFVLYGCFVLRVESPATRPAGAPRVSYAELARDRVLMRVVAGNLVTVAAAVALLNGMLPLFAGDVAHVSQAWIGVFFLVNALLIVGAQLPVAKALEGVRRMLALAAMNVAFAVSFLVWEGSAAFDGTAAALVILIGMALYSLAECVHAATQGPLVSDLVPPDRLARGMAANSFSWQLGFIAGPGIGGFVLGASDLALWPVAAALCVATAVWSLRIEPLIPEHARITGTIAGDARPRRSA